MSAINKVFQAGIDTSQVPVDLAMELTEYVNDHSLSGFTVTSLSDQSVSELQAAAENDIATLFSLNELVGFTISGNQPGYAGLNIDDYSNQYLEDRAAFLYYSMPEHDNPESIRYEQRDEDGGDAFVVLSNGGSTAGNYVFGADEHDAIMGDQNEDHLYGMGGDDTLSGQGGDDKIEGGKGQDTMLGGTGEDTFLITGTDNDYDIFNGGAGEYQDTILGSSGNDTIRVHEFTPDHSIERIIGGGGDNDIIAGTDMNDTINLSETQLIGIDRIEGGKGQDTITGSDGADTIYGGSQQEVEDHIRDTLEGGAGHDIYYVGNGDIINDSDNQGTIWFKGQQLSNLTFTRQGENSNIYKTDDYMASLDTATNTLSIHDRNTMHNFSPSKISPAEAWGLLWQITSPRRTSPISPWSGQSIMTRWESLILFLIKQIGNWNIPPFPQGQPATHRFSPHHFPALPLIYISKGVTAVTITLSTTVPIFHTIS